MNDCFAPPYHLYFRSKLTVLQPKTPYSCVFDAAVQINSSGDTTSPKALFSSEAIESNGTLWSEM